jgi:hypothetical protein
MPSIDAGAGADSSRTQLRYIEETTWGTTPASPTFANFRATGETMGLSKSTTQSAEIRSDRQVSDLIATSFSAGGGFGFELSQDTYDDFFAGALFGSWSTDLGISVATISATASGFDDSGNGLDDIIRLDWDFRNVRMWSGNTGQNFKDFTKVFQGRTDGVSVDLTGLNIRLRGPFTAIDRTLQTSFYTGTGGLEGSIDNKGNPKPKAWGENKNASPILLDAAKNLYQTHDGQIQSIDKVRDEGDPLTDAGVAADFATLDAWTPVAGQYKSCLSCGVFRIGDKPQGKLTVDFKGDASGTYVNSTSEVIGRIVTSHLGADNLAASDIDSDSFAALSAANTAPIHYYTGSNPITAREVIDKLATAIGAIWYFSRTGALTVKRVEPPLRPTATIMEANISSRGGGLKRVTPEQPTYEHRIRWGVNHTPMSENEIAPAVTSVDREFLNAGERYAVSENVGDTSEASVRSKFRKARALQIESFFVAESDAQEEADRRQAIWGLPRHRYTVPVTDGLFAYWVGDVVSLDLDRFGLSGGKNLLVVSVNENAKQNQATVELWG